GCFALGDSLLGKPGAHSPASQREQVSSLHRRRCEAFKTRAFLAASARIERAGNCRTVEARGPGALLAERRRGRDRSALAPAAHPARIVAGAGGEGGGNFGRLSERERAFADERLDRHAAQAVSLLQN